jgi:hypothetical protein
VDGLPRTGRWEGSGQVDVKRAMVKLDDASAGSSCDADFSVLIRPNIPVHGLRVGVFHSSDDNTEPIAHFLRILSIAFPRASSSTSLSR